MTTWGWVSAGWVSAGWALVDADLRLPTGRCEGSSRVPTAGRDRRFRRFRASSWAVAVSLEANGTRHGCPARPRDLLRHGQFVQSLARSLLRDAHQAEDVAQEAWARFVERGPREEGSSRGWLRTVTRNLAFNAHRRERTRRQSDERAARPEALPSAADELAQGECLRRVIEAVLALDEPYRATILGRYYQGRDLRSLAEETGTPLATVRSREQRALELLRTRLDRGAGGARASWALMLARTVGPAPAAASSSGALAATGFVKAAWLAVGVAAIAFVWGGVRHLDEPAAAPPKVGEASVAAIAQPVATSALVPSGGTSVASVQSTNTRTA